MGAQDKDYNYLDWVTIRGKRIKVCLPDINSTLAEGLCFYSSRRTMWVPATSKIDRLFERLAEQWTCLGLEDSNIRWESFCHKYFQQALDDRIFPKLTYKPSKR